MAVEDDLVGSCAESFPDKLHSEDYSSRANDVLYDRKATSKKCPFFYSFKKRPLYEKKFIFDTERVRAMHQTYQKYEPV